MSVSFLRWAGGKAWLARQIESYLPVDFRNYYEPFLGGGSIFFSLRQKGLLKNRMHLSDTNASLIETYTVLRDSPLKLIKKLKRYKNNENAYYRERDIEYNDPIERAARFIFLNRTSFNGIYRENLKGQYNVPYGYRQLSCLFEFDNLILCSELLQGAHLFVADFNSAVKKVRCNDLVFLDPPYTVAHEKNGFVKYNQKIFSWQDQVRLKETVEFLQSRSAHYILTNASHKSIKRLYSGIGKFGTISRASVIGGLNAKRDHYRELILTNSGN